MQEFRGNLRNSGEIVGIQEKFRETKKNLGKFRGTLWEIQEILREIWGFKEKLGDFRGNWGKLRISGEIGGIKGKLEEFRENWGNSGEMKGKNEGI